MNTCNVFCLSNQQRFLGSEPIEDVTEHVKNVKIDDKPKEVVEVVDEVCTQPVFEKRMNKHFPLK